MSSSNGTPANHSWHCCQTTLRRPVIDCTPYNISQTPKVQSRSGCMLAFNTIIAMGLSPHAMCLADACIFENWPVYNTNHIPRLRLWPILTNWGQTFLAQRDVALVLTNQLTTYFRIVSGDLVQILFLSQTLWCVDTGWPEADMIARWGSLIPTRSIILQLLQRITAGIVNQLNCSKLNITAFLKSYSSQWHHVHNTHIFVNG